MWCLCFYFVEVFLVLGEDYCFYCSVSASATGSHYISCDYNATIFSLGENKKVTSLFNKVRALAIPSGPMKPFWPQY